MFLDDPSIPATANASEQALRWSVIFAKSRMAFALTGGEICLLRFVLLSILEDDKVCLLLRPFLLP